MPLSKSEQMARVRNKNTSPEQLLRKALWRNGLRYRLGQSVLGVKPDIVFRRSKVVVFVDGCFWHGCPEHYSCPKSNPEFWAAKLRANVDRDIDQTLMLEQHGWRVVRIWEHTINERLEQAVAGVRAAREEMDWEPIAGWRVYRIQSGEGSAELRYLVRLRDGERRLVAASNIEGYSA